MAKRLRITVLVVSILAFLVLAVALAAWLLLGTDRVRERLETGLGEALDMGVQIGQPPRLGLMPGVNLTVADLEVSREGQVVATAENARVRISLLSLMTGRVRPLEMHIERPEIWVVRFSPGVFNIHEPEPEPEALDELSLRRLRVSDARLSYVDQASELEWLFEYCNLDLRNIRHAGGVLEQALATLAAQGQLKCRTLVQNQFVVSELSAEIKGENGMFEVSPIGAMAFEGRASGQFQADLSSEPPEFRLESRISEFDVGAFMTMLEPEQAASGKLDLELILNAQGRHWQNVRNSTAGSLSLAAGDLVLEGYDLDEELDGYAETQRFNLIDVGAVFLAGPIGLAASRGYAFSGLLEGNRGSTTIEQMVSEWEVEGGVAQARDVAFRTPENRLALAGALDFNDYRFEDMRVAVIDRDGCAIVEQRITGPFREPEVKQPNFLVTVAGPLLNLVERGVQAITDDDCDVFYSGSIPHP